MNNNHDQTDETLDEAELLLPWYVSGKISEEDRTKVEIWLESHPEADAHLARVSEEMDFTFSVSEALGRPSRASFEALMAEIGPGKPAAPTRSGIIDRIWEMLSPRYALAGAAALFLVVLGQAAVLTSMNSEQPAEFAVASGENAATLGLTALVRFSRETTVDEITALLDELDLRIIDGPKAGGLFVVAATDSAAGARALQTLAENAEIVSFLATQE